MAAAPQRKDLEWWLKVIVTMVTLVGIPVAGYVTINVAIANRPTFSETRSIVGEAVTQHEKLPDHAGSAAELLRIRQRIEQMAIDVAAIKATLEARRP